MGVMDGETGESMEEEEETDVGCGVHVHSLPYISAWNEGNIGLA